MLNVLTPDEVLTVIEREFSPCLTAETAPLRDCFGRVLAEDIVSKEFVPDFDRSTVDGYAVRGEDTFGCSESIPAILEITGSVLMGETPERGIKSGECMKIPTGGALPEGANAVQMVEYTEEYGDGTVGIMKSAAPGENLIYRGDDMRPGKVILKKGQVLGAAEIGTLAAMGITSVPVCKILKVGIVSTGDELIPPERNPEKGEIRDVNTDMLAAFVRSCGAEPVVYGIVPDELPTLMRAVQSAAEACDCVLLSGGSSVGEKDASAQVLGSLGSILFHGIAMKPGKPTILSKRGEKPLVGLPGHPAAAWFVSDLFVKPLLARLEGRKITRFTVPAKLAEKVSANHGRAQYMGVRLYYESGGLMAKPIRSKSGLISSLAGAEGYFCIPRDREGAAEGETVQVTVIG